MGDGREEQNSGGGKKGGRGRGSNWEQFNVMSPCIEGNDDAVATGSASVTLAGAGVGAGGTPALPGAGASPYPPLQGDIGWNGAKG